MENPATWTKAEWIVRKALDEAHWARENGVCGLSTERRVTDALRKEGLLTDDLPQLGVFHYDG